MDRRKFLKKCGLIPFIGSLAAVAKSETPESKSTEDNRKYGAPLRIFNGQVFEAPYPLFHTVIVQYFGRDDKWVLLSDPYRAQHGGSAMMVCYYDRKDGSYNPFYTQAELQEKLKDWKLVKDKRLVFARVLKIG